MSASSSPVLRVRGASLSVGGRRLWSDLDLDVAPGELIAVLGANGSGKTSLLRAVLGWQRLDTGSVELLGQPVGRGDRRVGYVPQQRIFAPETPLRGRDLVAMGLNGHRFGLPITSRAERRRVEDTLEWVGAGAEADRPVGRLSGGEQQRLRIGQALVGDPSLLLCDEPLSSLDLRHQRAVSDVIDRRRREAGTAVLFVTHDINPVARIADRVLYLAAGEYRLGAVEDVMRSDVLSELYGARIDVVRVGDRIIVAGTPDEAHHDVHHDHPGAHPGAAS